MTDLILHHYDMSPFCEKMRAVFGYKALAWRSVITSHVMPKPDLTALTGGYRKAPVLQIGRDIYCDTSLMLRVLDRLHPETALVPAEQRASCAAFAALEQTLFFCAIPVMYQPAGIKVVIERMGGPAAFEEFSKDRAALFTGGSASRPGGEFSRARFLPLVQGLDLQLATQPFLLGNRPTLADFAMYHPIWFIRSNPGVADTFAPFRNILVWEARMQAFGAGKPAPMTSGEALEAARSATEHQPFDGPVMEPDGVKVGQSVRIQATDYGVDPVDGTLVHASVFELVLKREDPRAGEVIVHFPRAGFRAQAA